MKHTRNTLYLALLSALFLFAGALTVRAAAAQQSGDQTDSTTTKKPAESMQTPTAPAPAAKPAAANASAASTPAAPKPATQQTRPANTTGMVWVNTDSGIYHKPGTRYYGKTKQGKYMSEADAIKAGYRAAGKN
ncbi:MAG TPA: signal protein [Verrucomicrobiae bacterium]|nr:signal protein [Verrucomicrobiae bacterium]